MGKAIIQQIPENNHNRKLGVLSITGADMHLVVDQDIIQLGDDWFVEVMTACGKLLLAETMVDVAHNQISCVRCRSVSRKYNHKIGVS